MVPTLCCIQIHSQSCSCAAELHGSAHRVGATAAQPQPGCQCSTFLQVITEAIVAFRSLHCIHGWNQNIPTAKSWPQVSSSNTFQQITRVPKRCSPTTTTPPPSKQPARNALEASSAWDGSQLAVGWRVRVCECVCARCGYDTYLSCLEGFSRISH